MFCSRCGAPLQENANFCGCCGVAIAVSNPSTDLSFEPIAPTSASVLGLKPGEEILAEYRGGRIERDLERQLERYDWRWYSGGAYQPTSNHLAYAIFAVVVTNKRVFFLDGPGRLLQLRIQWKPSQQGNPNQRAPMRSNIAAGEVNRVVGQLNLSPFWILDPNVNGELDEEFKEAFDQFKKDKGSRIGYGAMLSGRLPAERTIGSPGEWTCIGGPPLIMPSEGSGPYIDFVLLHALAVPRQKDLSNAGFFERLSAFPYNQFYRFEFEGAAKVYLKNLEDIEALHHHTNQILQTVLAGEANSGGYLPQKHVEYLRTAIQTLNESRGSATGSSTE